MPAKILKMMVLLVFIFLCPLLHLPTFGVTIDGDLKLLNNSTMKTIIDNGDIYDCVDINKQPAFDHPSLKNHKIQLRPSSYPVGLFDDDDDDISSSISSSTSIKIGLPDGGCPSGTVPIRRLTKENLMKMKSSLKSMKMKDPLSMHNDKYKRYHNEWAQYITSSQKPFESYGASGFIDVFGLQTKKGQLSASQILVANVEGDEINFVSAGWIASQEDYGDSKTRLNGAWTNDNFNQTGCIDTSCPGFVQISQELPLGLVLHPLSVYGGQQYGLDVLISKDPLTKNWWLYLEKNRVPIGYWPKNLFSLLRCDANKLAFGGIVGYLNNVDKPPMGSGHFAIEGAKKACFISNVKYVDKENKIQDLKPGNMYPFTSLRECYSLGPYYNFGPNSEITFYFGGPGCC